MRDFTDEQWYQDLSEEHKILLTDDPIVHWKNLRLFGISILYVPKEDMVDENPSS